MRLHLLDSDVPLIEGLDTAANCGKIIQRAHLAYTQDWSGGLISDWLENMACCPKCTEEAMKAKSHQYTYALVPGEKVKQQESEG